MPWYIPIISAIVGSAISLFSSYFVSLKLLNRQNITDRENLKISMKLERSYISKNIEECIKNSYPDTAVKFTKQSNINNLCQVYKGNTGKIGLLTTTSSEAVVEFYSKILNLRNRIGQEDQYDASDLRECTDLATTAIKSIIEVNHARNSSKQQAIHLIRKSGNSQNQPI
jgi:hypothetical protein